MLSPGLRAAIRTIDATPRVGRDFESSVPGLYFAGPLVAPSHGPVMRFVYGADYAVRMITDRLVATTARPIAVGGAG